MQQSMKTSDNIKRVSLIGTSRREKMTNYRQLVLSFMTTLHQATEIARQILDSSVSVWLYLLQQGDWQLISAWFQLPSSRGQTPSVASITDSCVVDGCLLCFLSPGLHTCWRLISSLYAQKILSLVFIMHVSQSSQSRGRFLPLYLSFVSFTSFFLQHIFMFCHWL